MWVSISVAIIAALYFRGYHRLAVLAAVVIVLIRLVEYLPEKYQRPAYVLTGLWLTLYCLDLLTTLGFILLVCALTALALFNVRKNMRLNKAAQRLVKESLEFEEKIREEQAVNIYTYTRKQTGVSGGATVDDWLRCRINKYMGNKEKKL